MSAQVRVRAPAKVNLSLAVLGKRPDGFHEVDTRMLALELADELVLTRSAQPGVQLRLSGPCASADIPSDATNLAARAAAEVLRRSGASGGIAIELVKHIPSGSGLGGGSSDAAAAWIGTAALLGIEVPAENGLAALGSDCVFFWKAANTGYARCIGRGEQVEPLPQPLRPACVALIVPDVACPTAAVYAAFRGRSGLENDLEPAALEAVPVLRAWRKALDSCGAGHWRLSGSGSSFFAPHDDPARAQEELRRVETALRGARLALRGSWVSRARGRGAEILKVV